MQLFDNPFAHFSQQVLAKPGTILRDALSKAMKMRELTPEMCVVYKCNGDKQVKHQISWDTDMMYLAGGEVSLSHPEP